MAFFRRDWLTEVVVDASPVGLGAILAQTNPHDESDRRIVCFASRLLTATERRYSQCEKEALAAVWACERFWLYLFGSRFRLVTDNRAVQLIFGPSETRDGRSVSRNLIIRSPTGQAGSTQPTSCRASRIDQST